MKKYKFRKYNPDFPKLFNLEKVRLSKILEKSKIEHIGSSAVKGLGGKGIIDIAIAVSKKSLVKTKHLLQKVGYIFKENGGLKKDYSLKKITNILEE